MKNKFIKAVSLVLLSVIVSLSVACGGSGKDETPYSEKQPYSLSFDAIGGKDVMPLSIFYSPYTPVNLKNGNSVPDFTDEKYIKLFADAGINIFSSAPEVYPNSKNSIEKVLTLAEKYNIGYFVKDIYVYEMVFYKDELGGPSREVNDYRIKTSIDELSEYKSFIGFNLYDEPPFEAMEVIGKVNSAVERFGDGKYATYVNLLPNWDLKYNKADVDVSYEQYIEEFLIKGCGKYFCFDHYVFDKKNYELYFQNLDIVKKYCDAYEVPFWSFIQAGGQWNDAMVEFESDDYFPSESQLIWNVNTSVACGAKGIQYFLGIQPIYFAYAPNGTYDFNRNAMIGADGSINEWYFYVQKANKQLLACDDVIMNSVNRGVIASGYAAEELAGCNMLIKDGKFHELVGVKGDALVGCLEHDKKTALYVVNYSMDSAQDIVLNFDDKHAFTVVQRAEQTEISGKNLKIHLEAGEAVLVNVVS